eukprot:8432267-Prorocentrum_lima.AAC.1
MWLYSLALQRSSSTWRLGGPMHGLVRGPHPYPPPLRERLHQGGPWQDAVEGQVPSPVAQEGSHIREQKYSKAANM